MAYETVVAVYDTPEHAQAAVKALKAEGFHSSDISIMDKARLQEAGPEIKQGLKQAGLWRRLFGDDIRHHEAAVMGRTMEEGGTVVSVRALDREVAHATGVLDVHRPIDIKDRAVTKGEATASEVQAEAPRSQPLAPDQHIATSPKAADVHGEVLRLAEEQLQVGKEMVETGRTRVRRFTTEREASKDVSLHDEHAEVMRRAVAAPASFKDVDWSDKEIEVVETAEHALVNKTARVVEEIELRKVGADHTETIHERLRRQEAEVRGPTADRRPPPPENRPTAH